MLSFESVCTEAPALSSTAQCIPLAQQGIALGGNAPLQICRGSEHPLQVRSGQWSIARNLGPVSLSHFDRLIPSPPGIVEVGVNMLPPSKIAPRTAV